MFTINEDMSIYATRGDTIFFSVTATNGDENYMFQKGDVVRFTVTEKKDCDTVVLQKDFGVEEVTDNVVITLTEQDTKWGDVISKPTDFWYEVELNPFTNPQTILGYDEDGAKIFKLFPEGGDVVEEEITPEDIPIVDDELDLTSTRPVQNQAIARTMVGLIELVEVVYQQNENIMENIMDDVANIVEEAVSKDKIYMKMNYDENTEALTFVLSESEGNA
jgi:hypothetical protein